MGKRIFGKYFLILLSTLMAFILLGIVFHAVIMSMIDVHPRMVPPVFVARILDRIAGNGDKIAALAEMKMWNSDQGMEPQIVLVDAHGKVLYPPGERLSWDWNTIPKPVHSYEYVNIDRVQRVSEKSSEALISSDGEHPGFFSRWLAPPRHFGAGLDAMIRLDGEREEYILVGPPPMPNFPVPPFVPLFGLASLLISLCLGVAAALAIIYGSMSKSVALADTILSEIQSGNLKARFPIRRHDEFGRAMLRFNVMADEIEKLVKRLRDTEHARTHLLQELAHDLRTPIASLKNCLEVLSEKKSRLTEEIRDELLGISSKEVAYFARLVEDLLFLAQVGDSRFGRPREEVDIWRILSEECEDCETRLRLAGKKMHLSLEGNQRSTWVIAEEHLLRRMIRNAMENAISFATSEINVMVSALSNQGVRIVIEDDGTGFSEESLREFGERRLSRKLDAREASGRISVGLGSVVMKTICQAHSGTLLVENRRGADGNTLGARVSIVLPMTIETASNGDAATSTA